jgi:S-adenosylmethionine:tRNA ribosyltransferase-isomerase
MQDVKDIRIDDFRYELPEDRIALFPLEERDASKLLVYKQGVITSAIYRDLSSYLKKDSLLAMNNTKVVEARFLFAKSTGGVIEVFCLEPSQHQPIEEGLNAKGTVRWHCMVGGISKWKEPVLSIQLDIKDRSVRLEARITERKGSVIEIEFLWDDDTLTFSDIMSVAGYVPLPPYLHRQAVESDALRYQTVYASQRGSVAAPTAGLHFTERLLNELSAKGIDIAQLTLHVGAGTFLPVKSETMSGHDMHKEWIHVELSFLEELINKEEKDWIAVGTTSLRTLETLYWMGVKAIHKPDDDLMSLEIQQWDPYEISAAGLDKKAALTALIDRMKKAGCSTLTCTTQLLIAPGYEIRMADAILTNFHQPGSTLLLLVSACIGDNWRKVYQYALDHEYRFLSYGDGSLLWCNRRS